MNIKTILNKEPDWKYLLKCFTLRNIDNFDYAIPPREIENVIESKLVTNEKLKDLLLEIITLQKSGYENDKQLFLKIKNESQLAVFLGYKDENAMKCVLTNIKYKQFYLPKKTGGFRKISVPPDIISINLRRLNYFLNLFYSIPCNVHGFVWGKNILTNAKVHVAKKYVLNVDIRDFFPSINQDTIAKIFQSSPFFFTKSISIMLSVLCCNDGKLPQGAPTSPMLSNIACIELDAVLNSLVVENDCIYTRYADDITFSANVNIFNKEFLTKIKLILANYGFTLNNNKIRLQTENIRQEVTGITINEKPNVKRKYIRNVRAILHSLGNDSSDDFIRKFNIKYNKYTMIGLPDIMRYIEGKINYIGFVRGKEDNIYLSLKNKYQEIKNDKSRNNKKS